MAAEGGAECAGEEALVLGLLGRVRCCLQCSKGGESYLFGVRGELSRKAQTGCHLRGHDVWTLRECRQDREMSGAAS